MVYDVMKNGMLNSFWEEEVEIEKDIESSELDFFYVHVEGKHD